MFYRMTEYHFIDLSARHYFAHYNKNVILALMVYKLLLYHHALMRSFMYTIDIMDIY